MSAMEETPCWERERLHEDMYRKWRGLAQVNSVYPNYLECALALPPGVTCSSAYTPYSFGFALRFAPTGRLVFCNSYVENSLCSDISPGCSQSYLSAIRRAWVSRQ